MTGAIMPHPDAHAQTADGMALVGIGASSHDVALRAQGHPPSALNENERMMLDLLDKTISTQEVLAAQQHVMANVIDYHGTQLERISSALDRVETILSTTASFVISVRFPTANRLLSEPFFGRHPHVFIVPRVFLLLS